MRKTPGIITALVISLVAVVSADDHGTPPPNPCDGALSLKLLDTPCRFADTRVGYGFSGPYGPPALTGPRVFDFDATPGSGQQLALCNVPSAAKAVMFVLTVDDRQDTTGIIGSVSCWPTGHTPFINSILNFKTKENDSNTATIALNASGQMTCANAYAPDAEIVIDLLGYYVACPCSQGGDDDDHATH